MSRTAIPKEYRTQFGFDSRWPLIGSAASDTIEMSGQRAGKATSAAAALVARAQLKARAATDSPAPQWWRVTFRLHSDHIEDRNVVGARPSLSRIKLEGWHEQRGDDGDEFFIHPDAIATVHIMAMTTTPPHDAADARYINRSK